MRNFSNILSIQINSANRLYFIQKLRMFAIITLPSNYKNNKQQYYDEYSP